MITPEQRFVKTVFTQCGAVRYSRDYWGRMPERVIVEPQRIQIVDTHPDQPGATLLDVELDATGHPLRYTFQSVAYPFLDGQALQLVLPAAIRQLRKR